MFRFTIPDVLEATAIGLASGFFGALLGVDPISTIYFAVVGAVLGFAVYLKTRTSRQNSNYDTTSSSPWRCDSAGRYD